MFSAGTGAHAGTLPNDLIVNGTGSFEVAPRCGFSGDVSGSGTLNYRTTYVRADVTGDWSAFSGQLNVINGGSGDFRIASSYSWGGLPLASVDLATGSWFYMSGTVNSGVGTSISIGALSGASGAVLRGGPTGDRTLTYRVGGKNTDATYAGSISEQGSTTMTRIVKNGTGRWTLGGACSHRGETVVESGTLRLTLTASITQTPQLTLDSGATLELQGATVTATGITLAEGATLLFSGGTLNGEPSLGAALHVDIAPVANGQSVVIIQNTAATPATGIFASKPEGALITSNGQTYRMTYLGGDGNDVALVALTSLEKWRLQHFGDILGSGNQADAADLDGDGSSNLLEYATAMNPSASDSLPTSAGLAGSVLEFIYTRSKAATDVSYVVEWSDDLSTWNTSGVTSIVITDGATTQQMKATVSAGVTKRFVRLRVTRP
jgi:autotransporter-associated beta strand protein